jgi:hypothetical protein
VRRIAASLSNRGADYRFLFDSWFARNRASLTPDRVAFLIIHSEANNARLTPAAVDQATAYVKSKLATLPTVVGYGFGDGAVDISTQALPTLPDGLRSGAMRRAIPRIRRVCFSIGCAISRRT